MMSPCFPLTGMKTQLRNLSNVSFAFGHSVTKTTPNRVASLGRVILTKADHTPGQFHSTIIPIDSVWNMGYNTECKSYLCILFVFWYLLVELLADMWTSWRWCEFMRWRRYDAGDWWVYPLPRRAFHRWVRVFVRTVLSSGVVVWFIGMGFAKNIIYHIVNSPPFPVQAFGVCSPVYRETFFKRISVRCCSCHYHWLLWNSDIWLHTSHVF